MASHFEFYPSEVECCEQRSLTFHMIMRTACRKELATCANTIQNGIALAHTSSIRAGRLKGGQLINAPAPLMVKTQLLICTLNPLCCAQSDQTANEQNSIGERDYVGKMELKVQLKLVPYILKARILTPTIPQKKLNFPQICPKMPQNGPKMTQNGPKWPKYDPKWPKMALE